jgi:hypothetical protein
MIYRFEPKNIPSITGVNNIPKHHIPYYKNEVLRLLDEKLVVIHQKMQKYDKKNNIENLNKLENDLNEFWNGEERVFERFQSLYKYFDDASELIFINFLEKIKFSTTNNIINDFLFYINFLDGEYTSEPISMEFIIKLINIKNKFSPNWDCSDLRLDMKDVNIEKDLHQQENNIKESIINILNLSYLKTWSYKYFSNKIIKEEDIVNWDRIFPNLFMLFYKDKELDEKLKELKKNKELKEEIDNIKQ